MIDKFSMLSSSMVFGVGVALVMSGLVIIACACRVICLAGPDMLNIVLLVSIALVMGG